MLLFYVFIGSAISALDLVAGSSRFAGCRRVQVVQKKERGKKEKKEKKEKKRKKRKKKNTCSALISPQVELYPPLWVHASLINSTNNYFVRYVRHVHVSVSHYAWYK